MSESVKNKASCKVTTNMELFRRLKVHSISKIIFMVSLDNSLKLMNSMNMMWMEILAYGIWLQSLKSDCLRATKVWIRAKK